MKFKYLYSFFLSFFVVTNFSCSAQKQAKTSEIVGVMFYNLENLFDTVNDPNKNDEVFLPNADRKWNKDKYEKKLENLSKVIAEGADVLPVLVGLCEVENLGVVQDLAAMEILKNANYGIVHFDSPDERGIDVALLYNKNVFTPKKSISIPVVLPGDSADPTRDILFVSGEIKIKGKKSIINIFVNHWPSRAGGEEISAVKRIAAATTLKKVVDSLNQVEKDPHIIILGDLNDTPFDISVQVTLDAKELYGEYTDECLVNLMTEKQKAGEGTYNYKGNWQAIDQIIVSESLLDGKKIDVDLNSLLIVKKDWMMFTHDTYGISPGRTYSGINYIGGYSDHLPVYIELIMR